MQKVSIFNYSFTNNASQKTCDVYIDGVIVDAETQQWYSMWYEDNTLSSFKSVRDQVNQAINDGATIVNVHVNSQGGSVIEAFAIKDYLDGLSAKGITVNKIGVGLVASAATLIVSGEGSSISPNSWFMVHNASGGVFGNVNDIENYAVTIREFNNQILKHYEETTGLSKTSLQSMMDNETWITGEDAVKLGFVAKLTTGAANITNQIKPENWMFQNKSVLAAYNSTTTIPPTQNSNIMDIKTITNSVKDAFIASLKEAGIIKDDNQKMCETLTNALDNALQPMNQGITDAVNDAVTERLKDMDTKVNTAVENVIADKIKDFMTAQSVEEKLNPITDEIKAIQDKLNDDAGSAGGKNTPITNEPKNIHNHSGVKW